jgi:hypothetical protein
MKSIKNFEEFKLISESMTYHLENKINLFENIYRYGSDEYFNIINEGRKLYNLGLVKLHPYDEFLIKSDLGSMDIYEGNLVYLDFPILEAQYHGKEVELNKPKRASEGKKKFIVYVKDKCGKVKKVRFGQRGMRIRNTNKNRAKSFLARMDCKNKKDKTTAGYWACNIAKYSSVNLTSSKSW